MIEGLAAFGCEMIVVKRGVQGQLLYDAAAKRRYEIPAYPSRMADITGCRGCLWRWFPGWLPEDL